MLDLGTLKIHIEADTSAAKKGLVEFETETKKTESTSKKASESIRAAFESIKSSISGAGAAISSLPSKVKASLSSVKKSLSEVKAAFKNAFDINVAPIKAKLDTITKKTEKLRKAASKVGDAGKAGFKAMAAGAGAAVGAVAAVGKQAFDSASQYEQLAGGTKKLFDKSSDTMLKYADEAYRTVGMSKNQYLEQANSLSAAMIKSLGGDTEAAANQTDKAMRVISDNASVFGTDMESVQNAFQGFAKENYTMLDNLKLGYGGSKEGMEQLLADAEKLSGVKYDISSLSDITDAIQVIQEKQGIAGNAEAEANKTVAGSIQMLQASYQNWLTDLGNGNGDIKQSTQTMVSSFGTAARNVIPLITGIFSGLMNSLPTLLSELGPVLSDAFAQLNLAGCLNTLLTAASNFISTFDLSEAAAGFLQGLQTSIANGDLGNLLSTLGELAGKIIKEVVDFVTNPANWWNLASGLFLGIAQFIKGIIQGLGGDGGGGNGGGDTNGAQPHAAGGVFTKPTLLGNGRHLVGEAGAEAIIPLKQSVLATMGAGMAQAYADAGGTMGRTTVNNYYLNNAVVNQDREIQEMFTKMMNEIRRKGGM